MEYFYLKSFWNRCTILIQTNILKPTKKVENNIKLEYCFLLKKYELSNIIQDIFYLFLILIALMFTIVPEYISRRFRVYQNCTINGIGGPEQFEMQIVNCSWLYELQNNLTLV